MMDLFGVLLLLALAVSFVVPVLPRKGNKRNLRGVQLSVKEWALLGDIAALKQVSQGKLVSVIVKRYLQERLADNTNVGRK